MPRPVKDSKATTTASTEGVQTAPATPSSDGDRNDADEEDVDRAGHLHLDVHEEDIDAEMNAFLAESDSEMGSDDGELRGR